MPNDAQVIDARDKKQNISHEIGPHVKAENRVIDNCAEGSFAEVTRHYDVRY